MVLVWKEEIDDLESDCCLGDWQEFSLVWKIYWLGGSWSFFGLRFELWGSGGFWMEVKGASVYFSQSLDF